MGEIRAPSEEHIKEAAKEVKKSSYFLIRDANELDIQSYAYKYNIDELLDAIAPVLANILNLSCGDVTLLNDEERALLDKYASWDRHNHRKRKTAASLIEENKDDTWGGNV